MTMRRKRSWRATTATRWKKCSLTLPAAATGRARHERTRGAQGAGDCVASHRRDGSALLVSPDVVLAADAGAGLLAGAADHHLGLSAELHRAERLLLRTR